MVIHEVLRHEELQATKEQLRAAFLQKIEPIKGRAASNLGLFPEYKRSVDLIYVAKGDPFWVLRVGAQIFRADINEALDALMDVVEDCGGDRKKAEEGNDPAVLETATPDFVFVRDGKSSEEGERLYVSWKAEDRGPVVRTPLFTI